MELTQTNETSNKTDPFFFYKTEQLTFMCILFVLTIAGNVTVLVLIFLSRNLKSRMNLFIANLACAGLYVRSTAKVIYGREKLRKKEEPDLLVGFFFLLTDIVWKITIEWHAGNVGCKVIKFIQAAATYGSTYALVALSIDRLDVIARPLNMSGRGKRCKLLIGLGWTFAVVFSSPMLVNYNFQIVQGHKQCWMNLPEDWMWKVYITLIAVAVFIIPAVIIAFCYIVIVIIIWSKSTLIIRSSAANEHTRIVSRDSNSGTSPVYNERRKKVHWTETSTSSRGLIPKAKIKTVKMTFVIVLAFVFCWSPYFIYDLLDVYGHIPRSSHTIALSTFIQSLAPLNSAANPIIYMLFNNKLYKKYCTKSEHSTSSTVLTHV